MVEIHPTQNVITGLRRSSEDGQAITAQGILRGLLTQLSTEAGQSSPLRRKLNDLDIDIADLQIALMPGASTHAASDLWTVDDQLGYLEYARAIYHFLRDPRTNPPMTISIQAPWGGGKTSLMRMLQRELDPVGYDRARRRAERSPTENTGTSARDLLNELGDLAKGSPASIKIDMAGHKGLPTVWFNAWIYQSGKQIWAGLGEAIIRGLSERLDPVNREKFLLRLHLARVDPNAIRQKVYEAAAQHFLGFLHGSFKWLLGLVILGVGTAIAAVGELKFGGASLGWTLSGSAAAAAASTLVAYAGALFKAKAEPADFSLSDYLDVPDYGKELGFVHHVTEDLRRVLDILPSVEGPDGVERQAPIVLFIDDLDRCSPSKIAEVFEAINLFVAGEFPNCYVILGMDSEIVAAALEEAHKDVVEHLPSYSRRTALGWRFMDKFVQLPFVIPPIGQEAVRDYAAHLAAKEDLAANQALERAAKLDPRAAELSIADMSVSDRPITEPVDTETLAQQLAEKHAILLPDGPSLAQEILERQQRLRVIDNQAKQMSQDSGEIVALLDQAHKNFSNNPRELKRLVNVYRFYMNLRVARESRGEAVPTVPQMRNWVMLALAWPEVMRWLRRRHSEWESEEDRKSAAETGRQLRALERKSEESVEYQRDTSGETHTRAPPLDDWTDRLEKLSGLSRRTTPWLSDERLFQFFKRIAADGPDASLAAGAGKGFW